MGSRSARSRYSHAERRLPHTIKGVRGIAEEVARSRLEPLAAMLLDEPQMLEHARRIAKMRGDDRAVPVGEGTQLVVVEALANIEHVTGSVLRFLVPTQFREHLTAKALQERPPSRTVRDHAEAFLERCERRPRVAEPNWIHIAW